MKLVDITDNYIEKFLDGNDVEGCMESYPALFSHYFKFCGDRRNFKPLLSREEVKRRKTFIYDQIDQIEQRLNNTGFRVGNLKVVLFVGQDCTNGHAFQDGKEYVVWIPVESYTSELQVRAFFIHEIIHSIHYSAVPDYYFSTELEKYNPVRQLVTEGVATYITKEVMGISAEDALWADTISKVEIGKWIENCKLNVENIIKRFIEDNNSTRALFEANNKNSIYNFRAGYYLGLSVIQKIVNENDYTAVQLASLSKEILNRLAKAKLSTH